MKLLTRRRTAATDSTPHLLNLEGTSDVDTPDADETDEVAGPGAVTKPSTLAMEWTGPSAWITKSLSWLLVTSLITGPVALVLGGWAVINSPTASPAPTSSSADATAADARTAVESFATEFVSTWLNTTTGQEARLDPFLPDLSAVTVPDVPTVVSGVSAAGIEATGDQTWAVTVATTTIAPTPADADPAAGPEASTVASSRRYFQVPIFRAADGSLIGLALPSPIAGPLLATGPDLGYRFRASTTDPVSLAAGEFLNALLTGVGDVTRLTTPGSPIRAITPAPYAAVSLDDVEVDQDPASISVADLADGRKARVLITATTAPTPTDPADPAAGGQGVSVQYALTLTTRAGRWEVTTIDPGPLTGESPATEPTQGTSPAPAGSLTAPTESSSTN